MQDISYPYETWKPCKPKVTSSKGVVVAQEIEAASIGARIIESGGNAIDGAIATAFALSVTEPWMSGLGGGGFMMLYLANENRVRVIDFGMISPKMTDLADYPLSGDIGADLFGWPAVAGDTNLHGAKSVAVPGAVAGYGLAVEQFATKSWGELIAPALDLAKRGHRKTWWTTLNVAAEAKLLNLYSQSRDDWLPDGFVPTVSADNEYTYLKLEKLAHTLKTLKENGPEYFYQGELAESLVADVQNSGGKLSKQDLIDYSAKVVDPITAIRGSLVYNLLPGMSAGPTFLDALENIPEFDMEKPSPDSHAFTAKALIEAYRKRFETMGHSGDVGDRSCTTNISVVDHHGNMVIMTTTLLSRFGSRYVAPTSGILLNNGINWFDPRPDRPNSISAGKKPLSNMCPMIATKQGRPVFGLGASGGRKILPAVFQLASYINDFDMKLDTALDEPRFDVSGINKIVFDPRFDMKVQKSLKKVSSAEPWFPSAFPSMYAVPSGVQILQKDTLIGAAHTHSPLSGAVGVG
jgi:gamma-glutamyltranspeptidase/glutathione hydrolase